jgi:hypothetical protein
MKKKKNFWRLWCKALGEKAGKNDREADNIAYIRTLLFLSYLITNCFIIAGVVRHWNDIPSNIPETKEERILNTSGNILKD